MIRLVLLLLVLAAIAFGASWIADRPGEISMVWQGWRIETSVPVALVIIALAAGVLLLVWRLLMLLIDIPGYMSHLTRRRKREKGWAAVTRGLLAIGTGDGAAARKARAEAVRLLPDEPLTHLLTAQEAQFEGEHELAVLTFQAMAEKPETRLLGLRGLHMEARKAGNLEAAAAFAEQVAETAPTLLWASDAVIEARCIAHDYAGALAILERQMAKKGIDKTQYRRRRAVLLTAEALALEHEKPDVAQERALEAVRLAPTLVPAAAVAGRLLGAAGQLRKAAKIVEAAFIANPHPELAEVEAHLRPGDSAQQRLQRVRDLFMRAPHHRESAIALAHAALDAHDFIQARAVLEPLLAAPTQRICLLMAELEAAENGDIGKAREWTTRAVNAPQDPAWIADGVVSDRWAPLSPVTGKLDAFVWAVPPGVSATPILEQDAERVKAAIAAVPLAAVEVAAPPASETTKADAGATPPHSPEVPVAKTEKPASAAAEAIIATPPLPDDPGPEPDDAQGVEDKRRIFGL